MKIYKFETISTEIIPEIYKKSINQYFLNQYFRMIKEIEIFSIIFLILYLNMFLIDLSLQDDNITKLNLGYRKKVLKSSNDFCTDLLKNSAKNLMNNSNRIHQNNILNRIDGVDLLSKIIIQSNDEVILKISFFAQKILKLRNNIDKSQMLRNFLKLNRQFNSVRFIIHGLTGEFSIIFSEKINQSYSSNDQTILQYVMQLYSQKISIIQNQIKKIFLFLNHQFNHQEFISTNKYSLNELKGFIKASPSYAWQALRSNTHVKKQKIKHAYEDARKFFFEKKFQELDQSVTKIFREIFIKKIQAIQKYQYPNSQRQKQFQNTYLLKSIPKGKLISEINLDQHTVDLIPRQKPFKLESFGGKVVIMPKLAKSLFAAKYQKEILKKFSNNSQHINLPKYYFIKNYQKQTQEYILTNLVDIVNYKQYLQTNSQTISMITKLHLIHQVTLALKFCRDSEIVYHNLIPKNIFIKKGLFIKITDFSNAFHSQINISLFQKHTPILSALPYVSNYESRLNCSFGDEKSDVFSLGNLLYETLYQKTPYNIKSSSLHQNFNRQINKLFSAALIAKQKQQLYQNQHYKLLTYISLQCIHHQRIINSSQKSDQNGKNILDENVKTINIKSRPYLDWMVVIIRSIIQNQKRRY